MQRRVSVEFGRRAAGVAVWTARLCDNRKPLRPRNPGGFLRLHTRKRGQDGHRCKVMFGMQDRGSKPALRSAGLGSQATTRVG